MKRAWNVFIDIVTVVWIGVFALSLAGPAGWGWWIMVASGVIFFVFAVDLVVIFAGSAGWRDFFARAWLDLVLLVPFFRIFKIGRVARLFRISRLARLVKQHKTLSRIFRAHVMETFLEGLDLAQKALERAGRFMIIIRK